MMRAQVLGVAALAVVVAGATCILAPSSARRALGECLRPATVEAIPLPAGCIPTNEAPPARAMAIVETERSHYHLRLQKVLVCRTATRQLPGFLVKQVESRWLPLYVGCCGFQFRRHVAVVVACDDGDGSMVVEAALLQNRWEYFRRYRDTDRSEWYGTPGGEATSRVRR